MAEGDALRVVFEVLIWLWMLSPLLRLFWRIVNGWSYDWPME